MTDVPDRDLLAEACARVTAITDDLLRPRPRVETPSTRPDFRAWTENGLDLRAIFVEDLGKWLLLVDVQGEWATFATVNAPRGAPLATILRAEVEAVDYAGDRC